jgi:hypothetical protein
MRDFFFMKIFRRGAGIWVAMAVAAALVDLGIWARRGAAGDVFGAEDGAALAENAAEIPGENFAVVGKFQSTRHKAALVALLTYNPTPQINRDFLCQSACLTALCKSFIQEGGYEAKRVLQILNIRDAETTKIALLITQLDGKLPPQSLPRTLQLATTVALCYTLPSANGLFAAIHAARLVEADPHNDDIAAATYGFLTAILAGNNSREECIKVAAANVESEKIAREIRAVLTRDYRNLPLENTGLGRFCRALHLWLKAQSWEHADRAGKQFLHYQESRRFLAVITAAWFDLPGLPAEMLLTFPDEHGDLAAALATLAQRGILLPVTEDLINPQLEPTVPPSTTENGAAANDGAADADAADADAPAAPQIATATPPSRSLPAPQLPAPLHQPALPLQPRLPQSPSLAAGLRSSHAVPRRRVAPVEILPSAGYAAVYFPKN